MMIDVVVVNYRTPDLYQECVRSIHEHFPPGTYNILGIDTSPNGEAVAPLVVENRGFGHACNVGAAKGGAPYLLFLNADTAATSQSDLENIQRLFDSPDVGIVGPKQLSPEGWVASAGCPPANNGVGYFIRGFHEPDRGLYEEPQLDCMYVPGSVLFCRREVWKRVGGFLEDPAGGFSQYHEDLYLCYAARHYGWRTVYTGRSLFLHHWDASPKPQHDQLQGRQWVIDSHPHLVNKLRSIGFPEHQIPPRV